MQSVDPELFELLQPPTFRGDVKWYRCKAIESGGPVLELGAGTGRITIPIARAGIDVTALELDPAILQKLREKLRMLPESVRSRVSVWASDMRSFASGERFALIIIPGHSFLHNVTAEDQLACLRCVHDHLRPGGEVAFNVDYPALEGMAHHAGLHAAVWRRVLTRDLPDGRYIVCSQAVRYDTMRQRVYPFTRCEHYGGHGELLRTHLFRLELAYLYPADILRLLREARLDLIRFSADFQDRPLQCKGEEVVVEARRRQ